MPVKFAVVCEAEADFRTATKLAERVLIEKLSWLEEVLETCPIWHGMDEGRPYLLWREVKGYADEFRIKAHGHFGEQPAEPDAHVARRALLVLKRFHRDRPPDGVLLIRDDDRQTERRFGLEQARDESEWRASIVIGLAHCKRESWVLAGFEPDDEEGARLAAIRAELGFDPVTSAHELTAKHDYDKRSAKRVLAHLTNGDHERESRCWEQADLRGLEARGKQSGLTDYLSEVRDRLIPVLVGPLP
jgi:hypothetical protein